MHWMCAALYGHFGLWAHSLRTVLMLIFALMMNYMLVRSEGARVMNAGYQVHMGEMLFSYLHQGFNMIMASLAFFVMMSEIPKQVPYQKYSTLRMTRRRWLASLMLFCMMIVLLYLALMIVSSVLFSLPYVTPGGGWSDLERLAADPDFIYELKLDGIRCVAYLRPGETDLRNKRNLRLLPSFPELAGLHEAVAGTCILDGELIIADTYGKPDFEALQARSMMTGTVRIRLKSAQTPANFVAFDILYRDGEDLTNRPLIDRKAILRETAFDRGRLAVSRTIAGNAKALFDQTTEQGLEGIVQKKKDSPYRMGKRSRDWVKVKKLVDEDFLACGYIAKGEQITSLVLGSMDAPLRYMGHVTLGVSRNVACRFPTTPSCPFDMLPSGNEGAVWYKNPPICIITYMERTSAGGMRQPRFNGFRED